MQCSLESKIPVIFGVLTVDNEEQALERIKKGREFAAGLVKMMILQDAI